MVEVAQVAWPGGSHTGGSTTALPVSLICPWVAVRSYGDDKKRFRLRFHFESHSEQLTARTSLSLRANQTQHALRPEAHNPKVAGSNPAPATSRGPEKSGPFVCPERGTEPESRQPAPILGASKANFTAPPTVVGCAATEKGVEILQGFLRLADEPQGGHPGFRGCIGGRGGVGIPRAPPGHGGGPARVPGRHPDRG